MDDLLSVFLLFICIGASFDNYIRLQEIYDNISLEVISAEAGVAAIGNRSFGSRLDSQEAIMKRGISEAIIELRKTQPQFYSELTVEQRNFLSNYPTDGDNAGIPPSGYYRELEAMGIKSLSLTSSDLADAARFADAAREMQSKSLRKE